MERKQKVERILIAITATAAVLGCTSKGWIATSSQAVVLASGGLYLSKAKSPEQLQQEQEDTRAKVVAELQQLEEQRSQISQEIDEMRLLVDQIAIEGEEEATKVRSHLVEQARADAQAIVEQARSSTKSIHESEQKLHEEILQRLQTEKDAHTEKISQLKQQLSEGQEIAESIITQAKEQSKEIIANTKASLHSTVYEPQEIAHQELLNRILIEKDAAITELERIQSLQEKTRVAIDKMKRAAQEENQAYRKKIQVTLEKQFNAQLQKMQKVLEEMEAQLHLVTSENLLLKQELAEKDNPMFPEGWSDHEIYARGIIEFYNAPGIGIVLDYKLSMRDRESVIVRVVPRDALIGEQKLRSYSDRLERKMDLAELPLIVTVAGTIQFTLRPSQMRNPASSEFVNVASAPVLKTQTPTFILPEVPKEQVRQQLEGMMLQDFEPPRYRYSPFEPISETERQWVLWLWKVCKIQNQNLIMQAVWKNKRGGGVTQGVGDSYQAARKKLHKILDEAGIQRRENG